MSREPRTERHYALSEYAQQERRMYQLPPHRRTGQGRTHSAPYHEYCGIEHGRCWWNKVRGPLALVGVMALFGLVGALLAWRG